jgi:hypothetical protein
VIKPAASTIASLQADVVTLTETNEANTGVIAAHVATIAARDLTIVENTGVIAGHVATIGAHDATILEHTATIGTHLATIAARDLTIVELNGKIVTVDTAADVKARELAASHGVVVPAKAPGVGNVTTEPAKTALTGMAAARSLLNAKLPKTE